MSVTASSSRGVDTVSLNPAPPRQVSAAPNEIKPLHLFPFLRLITPRLA